MILVAKELDTELQVEGIPKAEVKAKLLHALTERSMLRGTVKPAEMTELQFQLEMKKLEMQERENREQREYAEREAEKQRQFEIEKEEREFQRQKELARDQCEFKMREMEKKERGEDLVRARGEDLEERSDC